MLKTDHLLYTIQYLTKEISNTNIISFTNYYNLEVKVIVTSVYLDS